MRDKASLQYVFSLSMILCKANLWGLIIYKCQTYSEVFSCYMAGLIPRDHIILLIKVCKTLKI